jgi:acyl carrier protein
MRSFTRESALVLIAEEAGLQDIDENTDVNELGDSLERVQLIVALEREYDFDASDSEIDRLRRVGDVLELIEKHVGQTSTGSTNEATEA